MEVTSNGSAAAMIHRRGAIGKDRQQRTCTLSVKVPTETSESNAGPVGNRTRRFSNACGIAVAMYVGLPGARYLATVECRQSRQILTGLLDTFAPRSQATWRGGVLRGGAVTTAERTWV